MSLSHISKFVLWGSVGFILGIGLLSLINISADIFILIISGIAIISIFVFYRKCWLWCFIVFLLFTIGGVFVMNNVLININAIETNVGKKISGKAVVINDIVKKDWYSNVVLKYDDGHTVLIKDEKYTELERGSITNLKCITEIPKQYSDFDYQRYLFMNGIEYTCSDFEYEITGFEQNLLNRLSIFRSEMESVVNNIIPSPQAALANGLLFGGDDRLSEELQEKFAQTGMTHIVAVSGYNVSVIVVVVISIVIFVGVSRKYAVIFAIFAILFFVALIGFPSSGVRAAIMGSMILVAASYGRISHAYGAIFFTGAIMIAFNPLLLIYDVGFQLSFLATLGIVAIYPILEKYFTSQNKIFGVVDISLLTISAQVFVLPIIAYNFHTLSVISLIANVLILPIIPITMLFVFLTVVLSSIFYPMAVMFGWLAYFLLSYEIFVIDILSKISWNSIVVEDIGLIWFVIYYVFIVSIVYFMNKKILYET